MIGRALSEFRGDRRGAISIIASFSIVLVTMFAALAVDAGAVFLEGRRLQGVADLAAIAAARDLDRAEAAARATALANVGGDSLVLTVTPGVYTPDPGVAPDQRFVAGGVSPTAARVVVQGRTPLFFAQIFSGRSESVIERTATAARAELASFSIGTRLASLQDGVANQLLGGLTGSKVKLSVMDYNALASADVGLFDYMRHLRTHAGLELATFNDALSSNLTTGQALQGLSDALLEKGQTQAAGGARLLASAAGSGVRIDLKRLLDLGPYGAQDHHAGATSADVSLRAMDLALAILTLANEGRQVKLDLAASAPGLTSLDVWLAIGERPNNAPWMSVSRDGGPVIRTAQMRLYVQAKLVSNLGLLGVKPVTLPLFVEAASAQARLATISCPSEPATQAVRLSVMPSLGTVNIGEIHTNDLNDFKRTLQPREATFVDLSLLKATGSARVTLGGASWQDVNFSRAEILSGAIKTVSTRDLATATAASLLANLDLNVNVLGLGLNAGSLTQTLSTTLGSAAPVLDQNINALTDVLGIRLGQADVRVAGLRCRDAALVS